MQLSTNSTNRRTFIVYNLLIVCHLSTMRITYLQAAWSTITLTNTSSAVLGCLKFVDVTKDVSTWRGVDRSNDSLMMCQPGVVSTDPMTV